MLFTQFSKRFISMSIWMVWSCAYMTPKKLLVGWTKTKKKRPNYGSIEPAQKLFWICYLHVFHLRENWHSSVGNKKCNTYFTTNKNIKSTCTRKQLKSHAILIHCKNPENIEIQELIINTESTLESQ